MISQGHSCFQGCLGRTGPGISVEFPCVSKAGFGFCLARLPGRDCQWYKAPRVPWRCFCFTGWNGNWSVGVEEAGCGLGKLQAFEFMWHSSLKYCIVLNCF